jgi:hypothetical protein
MSRHFKAPEFGITFNLIRGKKNCIIRGHQNIEVEFNLERFGIYIVIKDCSDCVRTKVNAINRCRSKKQLYLLLTKLKEKYTDGNNRKDSGIEAENAILSV